MKSIFIDTDIGTDFDDALALVLAAQSEKVELQGVTTVSGDTTARARIAMHLLELCGLGQVPVAAGLPSEISVQTPSQYLPGQMSHHIPGSNGVQLLLDTVAANPGLTVVTLGPLTNLAACIRRAPELMQRARLVIMGGMVTAAYPEGNITSDVQAAKVVFESSIPKTMIGLDVTTRCILPDNVIQKLLNRPDQPNACLFEMLGCWKRDVLAPILQSWGDPVPAGDYPAAAGMHDPMAVAFVLWPELFTLRPAHILVETQGLYTRGVTVERINPFREGHCIDGNTMVATDVQQTLFMERFLQTFSQLTKMEEMIWNAESISMHGTKITTATTPVSPCAVGR